MPPQLGGSGPPVILLSCMYLQRTHANVNHGLLRAKLASHLLGIRHPQGSELGHRSPDRRQCAGDLVVVQAPVTNRSPQSRQKSPGQQAIFICSKRGVSFSVVGMHCGDVQRSETIQS